MLGPVRPLFQTVFQVARDLVALIASAMRSRAQLSADVVGLTDVAFRTHRDLAR